MITVLKITTILCSSIAIIVSTLTIYKVRKER